MHTMNLEQLREHLASSPFIRSSGVELAHVDHVTGTLVMVLPWRGDGEVAEASGTWHGGPIASLIDTAGAFAAAAVAGRDCGTVTLQVDYLRPARGRLVATARVRKPGRTLSTVDIDVVDETSRVCALGRGTFFVSGAG